jgi:hypothetical protein
MTRSSIRGSIVAAALIGALSTSGYAQPADRDTTRWRTSFEAFVQAIEEFPPDDVSFSTAEEGEWTGKRVVADEPIMRRFGGEVEFDGVFEGLEADSPPMDPGEKREKLHVSMDWPAGLRPTTLWKVHLYPKASSLPAWRALEPKSPVRFRALVTGITVFTTFIPGVHQGIAILLEDVEIVSCSSCQIHHSYGGVCGYPAGESSHASCRPSAVMSR